tara:strand:+ start:6875 stop:8383 length:1509 start_codon:yes stop_codon:yes gene_type:complete
MKKTLLLLFILFSQFSIGQTSHTVYAGNFYYSPSSLTINVGDEVTWINENGYHDVNADINSITGESFNNPETFDSPSVSSGTIYTHTFNVEGTYNYDCSVGSHAENGMVGQIIVVGETTVVDVIVNSENHTTLETAVVTAGLVETLSGEGPFTVFAPTDDAFDALPEGTLDAVLADMELLTSILTHHVAAGAVFSTDLADGMMVTTLNGTELMVTINENGVMIDNAMVTVADYEADNGVVHVIDAVLIPENECEDDNETIEQLFGAMFISDCEALVGFLMTNYNYSEYQACNWDGQPMFSLESNVSEICGCACQNVEEETTTVVDIIANSDNHNTLEYALGEAGFIEYLSGEGPFTVFAPTDDAFDALPEGTLDAVLTDFELLASILKYHVVTGSVYSTDLTDGMMVTTLEGADLMVTIDENGVMINNAMVTVADYEADNGVVHVIDAVLIPESSNINENLLMNNDRLLFRVDELGRQTKSDYGLIIELYESGRNVKKYKIK